MDRPRLKFGQVREWRTIGALLREPDKTIPLPALAAAAADVADAMLLELARRRPQPKYAPSVPCDECGHRFDQHASPVSVDGTCGGPGTDGGACGCAEFVA